MWITVRIAAIFLSLAALSACVSSGSGFRKLSWSKNVVSGHTIVISESGNVTEKCTSSAIPVARIAVQPKHGSVKIKQEKVYPALPASNPRSRCNSKRISGIAVYYTANSGFQGNDEVKINVGFESGHVDEITVRIRVH